MADNNRTPPKFDGLNFSIWKVKMIIFLQSLGSWVAKAVTKLYSAPTGDDGTWSDIAAKEYEANSKAQNALFLAWMRMTLQGSFITNSPMRFGNTYWSLMREHHKSRELKLISCVFNMKISPCKIMTLLMAWRFTKITNDFASLDDVVDNNQKVRKAIWALPPS